jgi:hypothetical protein
VIRDPRDPIAMELEPHRLDHQTKVRCDHARDSTGPAPRTS